MLYHSLEVTNKSSLFTSEGIHSFNASPTSYSLSYDIAQSMWR